MHFQVFAIKWITIVSAVNRAGQPPQGERGANGKLQVQIPFSLKVKRKTPGSLILMIDNYSIVIFFSFAMFSATSFLNSASSESE